MCAIFSRMDAEEDFAPFFYSTEAEYVAMAAGIRETIVFGISGVRSFRIVTLAQLRSRRI